MFKIILVTIFITNLFSAEITTKKIKLLKGDNYLKNSYATIDVENTFNIKGINKVVLVDDFSKKTAIYPFSNLNKNLLNLKFIEKGVEFNIYSEKDFILEIKPPIISKTCQKIIDSNKYNILYDSGIVKKPTIDNNNNIAISSRYYSNHKKNMYDDTTILFIYPKIDKTTKMKYKYGPGKPKVFLQYSKEYENKEFYIYDFSIGRCYKGLFPSLEIPPFRNLRDID